MLLKWQHEDLKSIISVFLDLTSSHFNRIKFLFPCGALLLEWLAGIWNPALPKPNLFHSTFTSMLYKPITLLYVYLVIESAAIQVFQITNFLRVIMDASSCRSPVLICLQILVALFLSTTAPRLAPLAQVVFLLSLHWTITAVSWVSHPPHPTENIHEIMSLLWAKHLLPLDSLLHRAVLYKLQVESY